jgi:hypothetical protein
MPAAIAWLLRSMLTEYMWMRHDNLDRASRVLLDHRDTWGLVVLTLAYGYWHPVFLPLHLAAAPWTLCAMLLLLCGFGRRMRLQRNRWAGSSQWCRPWRTV